MDSRTASAGLSLRVPPPIGVSVFSKRSNKNDSAGLLSWNKRTTGQNVCGRGPGRSPSATAGRGPRSTSSSLAHRPAQFPAQSGHVAGGAQGMNADGCTHSIWKSEDSSFFTPVDLHVLRRWQCWQQGLDSLMTTPSLRPGGLLPRACPPLRPGGAAAQPAGGWAGTELGYPAPS